MGTPFIMVINGDAGEKGGGGERLKRCHVCIRLWSFWMVLVLYEPFELFPEYPWSIIQLKVTLERAYVPIFIQVRIFEPRKTPVPFA